MTCFTGNLYIREEIHFNDFQACALTGFTTTSFDIE